MITPAPELPADLERRDSLTTISVSSCYNYADPDQGGGDGCECPGYGGGLLPLLTTMLAGNSTTVGCDYSTIVTVSSSTNPFPYTSTYPNSAIVAYANTQGYPDGGWVGAGDSTTIKAGTQISMELNPTASVNVGTLVGSTLYTSVSSALVAACGTVGNGPMQTCGTAQITGIAHVEDYENDLWTDGTLDITVPFISAFDQPTLDAMIASVAGAVMASSTLPNNTATIADDCTNNIFNSASGCQSSVNITNVASLTQAIYTDDTGSAHSPQSLAIAMAFSDNGGPDYLCDAGALSAAAIYYGGFVCDMLGAIPGFEWATAIGDAIEVVDGASDGVLNGIALGCEVSTLASG